jgi:hypothetical protein
VHDIGNIYIYKWITNLMKLNKINLACLVSISPKSSDCEGKLAHGNQYI